MRLALVSMCPDTVCLVRYETLHIAGSDRTRKFRAAPQHPLFSFRFVGVAAASGRTAFVRVEKKAAGFETATAVSDADLTDFAQARRFILLLHRTTRRPAVASRSTYEDTATSIDLLSRSP